LFTGRDRLEKETAFFKTEANRMKHNAVDTQRETEALETERTTLSSAIATGENEISKQRYYATCAESRKLNYMRKLMTKEKVINKISNWFHTDFFNAYLNMAFQDLKDTWERWRTLHSMVRIGVSVRYNLIFKNTKLMY
jgi:hypothetical protein